MKTLLLGSGTNPKKQIVHPLTPDKEFTDVTTLDMDADLGPDVVHDLEIIPYPFEDGQFDEIHAYEVLEHTGSQGDFRFFFAQFNEFHRILRPGGVLCGSVPLWTSPWALGDPGHKRVLPPQTFSFLELRHYDQLGSTPCADYRSLIDGYWEIVGMEPQDHRLFFILMK